MIGESKLLLEAYPLHWPEGQARKPPHQRRHGPFKVTLGVARDELMSELRLLRAKDIVITSNVPTRRDGLPYADAREPSDPGVAVYFERNARQFVFACDTFSRFLQNLRAVGMTVGALRAIQRYGATEMLEQAFTGFAALPAAHRERPWWDVLGVSKDATLDLIVAAHRQLVLVHHPDRGGAVERMAEINKARDEADVALTQRSNGTTRNA